MPYRSAKQRAYMHIHHPDIAARWDAEFGGKIAPKKSKGHTEHDRRHRRKKRSV